AAHVFNAHIDDALEAEQRAHGRGSDTVLPRAGLGDDAALAHAAREEGLPQAVIDLVRAGVEQVLTLEPDARAAERVAEALAEIQWGGAAGVVVEEVRKLGLEGGVATRREVGVLQLFDGRHQNFGDVAPAVRAEVSAGIGLGGHARLPRSRGLPACASRST